MAATPVPLVWDFNRPLGSDAAATAIDPDVLIVDEALSVGDLHFQKKSLNRILELRERGATVLFCSHNLYQVRSLCQRAAWIHGGRVEAMGKTEDLFLSPTKDMQAIVENEYTLIPGGTNIRLMFPRVISQQSVITQMARALGIDFSIVGGKLERYLDDVFGFLIINVQDQDIEAVLSYLEEQHLYWEILEYPVKQALDASHE